MIPGPITLDASLIRRMRRTISTMWPFLVVLSLMVLFPNRTQATCGDYLGTPHSMIQPALNESLPADGIPHEQRCRGPLCRQGQTLPADSGPFASQRLQDHWAWIADDISSALQEVAQRDHSIEPMLLPTIIDRLDRPPRS